MKVRVDPWEARDPELGQWFPGAMGEGPLASPESGLSGTNL